MCDVTHNSFAQRWARSVMMIWCWLCFLDLGLAAEQRIFWVDDLIAQFKAFERPFRAFGGETMWIKASIGLFMAFKGRRSPVFHRF